MSVNLLTNRRRKTRGDSVYADGNQTGAVANTNETIGQAPIMPDSPVHEEPSLQNVPAPTRTRTIGFNLQTTMGNLQTRKPAIGETVNPQPPRPGKAEAKGDGAPEDNSKGQGNALEAMQAKFTAAKSSPVWGMYTRKAEEEDRDLVEDWDRIIDVTLVFAALFSAISTGFVLESSKNLQPDQAKETVLAIQNLATSIQAGANGSAVPTTGSSDHSFKPTALTIWVNCLWFLSLGLSISVSLFAMLAKRWCYTFRSKRTGTSHERAIKRQKQWDAIERWKIELVIEQLPTLMHIALMLFFLGLVVYLAEIHLTIMIVTAALVGLTIVLYIILTVLPLWYRNCPMVTPFTRILWAMHWYVGESSKFITTKARSQLENTSVSLTVRTLYARLLNWRELLDAAASAPKRGFYVFGVGVTSLWKQLVRWTTVIIHFMKQEKPPSEPSWVISGCTDLAIGKTAPRPQLDEDNRYEFGALVWILNNSTDLKTVKEVLDHIMSFPDVILESFADSNQLHTVALKAVEHLNRFQHDPAEWRHTSDINSSFARLIYLFTRPWLHQSTEHSSHYWRIQELSWTYQQLEDRTMSPDEVETQVATIKAKVNRLAELTLWLEGFAAKVVLGCSAQSGLTICAALGSILLKKETRLHTSRLDAEAYPTLWWIFLNNVMACTGGYWPQGRYVDQPKDSLWVSSDSMLTLSHFRDSRKRQESGLWLAVVGITGMFHAFTIYADHENGPTRETNKDYFLDLIHFLRRTLRTQITLDADPFIGDLPVYNGTEIRLYEFDSLQYGIDAVTCALDDSIYTKCSLSSDLRMLLCDLNEFKVLKDLIRPKEIQDMDHSRILELYKSKAQEHDAADRFLTAGVLLINPFQNHLDRDCARLLASFVPDIIFGRRALDPSTPPAFPKEFIGMPPATDLCIKASDTITSWAWMPFGTSIWLQDVLKTKYPNYRHRDMLWEPLEGAGLLREPTTPQMSFQTYTFFSANYREVENLEEGLRGAYRAAGYCLYIKAGLLNRLYSFAAADVHSPDILAWSITLSHHVAELLQFWDAATFDMDEQTCVIGSLVKLTNTLLDVLDPTPSLEPIKPSQTPINAIQSTPEEATNVRGRLEALIKAGVLPILARPFGPRSRPPTTIIDEYTQEQAKWDNDLTRTIERLARTFPTIRAERGFATLIDDTLRAVGKPEWAFNQQRETSGGDGSDNHSNSSEVELYSDMVAYYEAKALENIAESLPILECVKRLRDDMEAHHPPTPPRAESPDVRIDISQDRE